MEQGARHPRHKWQWICRRFFEYAKRLRNAPLQPQTGRQYYLLLPGRNEVSWQQDCGRRLEPVGDLWYHLDSERSRCCSIQLQLRPLWRIWIQAGWNPQRPPRPLRRNHPVGNAQRGGSTPDYLRPEVQSPRYPERREDLHQSELLRSAGYGYKWFLQAAGHSWPDVLQFRPYPDQECPYQRKAEPAVQAGRVQFPEPSQLATLWGSSCGARTGLRTNSAENIERPDYLSDVRCGRAR